MLMNPLKLTPGVCPLYPQEPQGVMGGTPITIILKCHLIQMGLYKNQDLQVEAIPEVILNNIQHHQLVTVFQGIPMELGVMGAPWGVHPHPLQDMVPMTEGVIMEDLQNFHQIITSCHPRERSASRTWTGPR